MVYPIVSTAADLTLENFGKYYNIVGKQMMQLCVMAYELEKKDHNAFWTYALTKMNASKSTISAMVRSGRLYHDNPPLLEYEVPYTKVFELSPVSEQVNTYIEDIGGVDQLNTLSQKEIRASVKKYVSSARESIDMAKKEPAKGSEPAQLGFAETMNRERIVDILNEIVVCWKSDHNMRLDKLDIANLLYIITEVQKEV